MAGGLLMAVPQVNFKSWFEAVQLVRGYQDSHNVSPLGKLGWWTVYSAKEPEKTGQIGGGSMGYNFSQQPDHVVDMRDTHVKPVFEEAAQRLARLGFPRMHANVVIVNLGDMENQITGGGVGGYASNKKHGFTVDRSNIDVSTIIHEHAHMYWFNLPKDNQEFFKKYYKEAITDKSISPQDMWQHAKPEFDSSKLDKILENSWWTFSGKMNRLLGKHMDVYFNLQEAMQSNDQSRMIESALLNRFGTFLDAVAKRPIDMERLSGYGSKTVDVGDKVTVEKVRSYIINQFVSDGKDSFGNERSIRWEHKKPMEREDIHKFVEFKEELLRDDQKEQLKEMQKVMKGKPSQFFAPHKQKEEIEALFQDVAEEIAQQFAYKGTYNPTTFDAKQLFPFARFYQTWMSRIGRRFKAGKITDMEGIKQTYMDSIKSQLKGDLKATPANINPGDLEGYDFRNIGDKRGANLRNLIHQQGTTPSAYAAANIDELFAVSVEHAAMGWDVSRQLKKLIYSTVSGTAM